MPEIVTRTLACGLPLLVEPSTAVRSAAVSWLLPAGTAMDPADQLGRSAMFAELLFRGAGSLDSKAQADALDRLGLGRGCEVGGVFLRLAATMIADRVHEALHLLADMALRPRFDDAAIEPTRQLCIQAVAGLNDEPAERAANILLQRHNPAPLNRASVGTEQGLANVTADSLRAGWAQCVRPGGSILAVAGNVDPDAVAATLDAALAGWSGAAAIPPVTPSTTAGTLHHQHDQSNQVHIYLAHHAPAEPHPDSLLEKLVTGVLSAVLIAATIAMTTGFGGQLAMTTGMTVTGGGLFVCAMVGLAVYPRLPVSRLVRHDCLHSAPARARTRLAHRIGKSCLYQIRHLDGHLLGHQMGSHW